MRYLLRGFLVWLLFIPLAVANGILRDLLLTPVLGDAPGRAASSLTLSLLIYGVTLFFIPRLSISSTRACLAVGSFWMVLTLLFEFTFFVLVMGHPMDVLFQDYDLFRGRLWILVLATTFFAPLLAARARKIRLF